MTNRKRSIAWATWHLLSENRDVLPLVDLTEPFCHYFLYIEDSVLDGTLMPRQVPVTFRTCYDLPRLSTHESARKHRQ